MFNGQGFGGFGNGHGFGNNGQGYSDLSNAQNIQPKPIKLTKSVAENVIAGYLMIFPQQLKFIKLAELPKEWKHACVPTGAVHLPPIQLPFQTTFINFAFCQACGEVQYHYDDEYNPF